MPRGSAALDFTRDRSNPYRLQHTIQRELFFNHHIDCIIADDLTAHENASRTKPGQRYLKECRLRFQYSPLPMPQPGDNGSCGKHRDHPEYGSRWPKKAQRLPHH